MRWSVKEPENELKHYGVLGMKWGVRKEPEQKAQTKKPSASTGKLKTQSKTSTAKSSGSSNGGYPSPLKESRAAWEKEQIAQNRIDSIFGTATYRKEKGLDISYRGDPNGGEGHYYVSKDGGKFYSVRGDDFVKVLVDDFGYDKEEAEAMIADYDSYWLEQQRVKDMVEEDKEKQEKAKAEKEAATKKYTEDFEKKQQEEFDAYRKANSKNVAASNAEKNSKNWKEKVADGAKKVTDAVKNVGSQATSAAKSAIDSGKNFLDDLFKKK